MSRSKCPGYVHSKVCEGLYYKHVINAPSLPYEDEVAKRWWALAPGSILPLSNGEAYHLLFAGRPGTAAGPDVHDAVLAMGRGRASRKCVGDVEFHVRVSDWVTHRHHTDVRYNNVVLHVVLLYDDTAPTLRQDGTVVPVCSLYDLPLVSPPLPLATTEAWPCHHNMDDNARLNLLRHAGLQRFEQKTHAFVECLHQHAGEGAHDRCLVPTLIEALGYGRDRAFFHALGLRLVNGSANVPEPLGRSPAPAPLDSGRFQTLKARIEQWRVKGVWQTVRGTLEKDSDSDATLSALRALLSGPGLSLARADILICNVVLPFAAAVALVEQDTRLLERSQELYMQHPGLPSNRITRRMCVQLLLDHEPAGSCQQQGLQYVYQQTCREKQCEACMLGRQRL